jgi:hypothetical protein
MAFLRLKSLNPSKLTLPNSGLSLEVRSSNNKDFLHLMKAYINSTPEDFSNEYLQKIMISGEVDIKSLPLDDLHFLLTRLLEQEGKCSILSTITDKSGVLKTFRDEIIGVPHSRYISKKDKMTGRFQKECDKWLKTIEVLIEKNDSEKKNLKFNALLDKHRKEEKSVRLKKNITKLNAIKRDIVTMKQNPEVHILQALQPDNLSENNFDQSFNFIRISLKKLDHQYLDFPFRWCGFLPSDKFNRLYREWKQGKDIMKQVVDSFHEKDIENFIYAEIERSPINVKRKEILFDGLECFYEKKYASTIVLLLPQIEGLLWELAEQFNNGGKFIYKTSAESSSAYGSFSFKIDKNQGSYYLNNDITKHYTEVEQKDLSILSLRENDKGEMIKIEDIGTLLKKTAFRFYLYADFIEYFCNELYAQRNEILHGRDLDFGTVENAVKKTLALLMILYYFNEIK